MKPLGQLDRYRDVHWEVSMYGGPGDDEGGCFRLKSPCDPRLELRVIASSGMGWDHVSVSTARRCPNWEEMEFIKRRFFAPGEVAMQLHVAESDHISMHPHCLHIWRPQGVEIPLPPSMMVGLAA